MTDQAIVAIISMALQLAAYLALVAVLWRRLQRVAEERDFHAGDAEIQAVHNANHYKEVVRLTARISQLLDLAKEKAQHHESLKNSNNALCNILDSQQAEMEEMRAKLAHWTKRQRGAKGRFLGKDNA